MNTINRYFLLLLSLFCLHAQAAIVLTNGAGKITGAADVIVDGESYSVNFIDGSCIDLYSGCDENSDFVFNTLGQAATASQALLDQVFIDLAPNSFDIDPENTVGCTNSGLCRALTLYALSSTAGTIVGATADNDAVEANDIVTLNIGVGDGLDLNDVSIATYAVWTANPSPVPLPASIYLFTLALSGVLLFNRRVNK